MLEPKSIEEALSVESHRLDEELMGFRNAMGSYAEICDSEDSALLVFERWEEAFLAASDLERAVEEIKDRLGAECRRREDRLEDDEA
jgi:hypothetical protein